MCPTLIGYLRMKKILFSFVALTIAVAANAFSLTLPNEDPESAPIVITTDNPDVYGNGTVAVRVDEANDVVHIVLTDAYLYSYEYTAAFSYVGDATYQDVILHINGLCELGFTEKHALTIPFQLSNATMQIVADAPGAELNIDGEETLVSLYGDASLYIGNMMDNVVDKPLIVYCSQERDYATFKGSSSGTQEVYFLLADVYITTKKGTSNPFFEDLEDLGAISLPEEDVLKFKAGQIWKEVYVHGVYDHDEIYEAKSLTLTSPCAIMVGEEFLYPYEKQMADFQPAALKNGKISFNAETMTLTLEDAEIDGPVAIGYKNATVYLKGGNNIKNTAKETDARLTFFGGNATIDGDKDASLTISCNAASCDAINAADGLVIGDFNDLTIYGANFGISGSGSDEESNTLTLKSTPVSLYAQTAVIIDFLNFNIEDPELQLPESRSYSGKVLVDTENASLAQSLNLSYPSYFTFYDNPVNSQNASDIKVSGCDGKASYDAVTKTLTLNNFDDKGAAIASNAIYPIEDMTIKLIGNNALSASSAVIETSANLVIEGSGVLKLYSEYYSGIQVSPTSELTIRKGAKIEIEADYNGIASDAALSCMSGGFDPITMEELPGTIDGDAAILNIDNADVHIITTGTYGAAVKGFKEVNLKDAAIAEPEGASFVFGCDGSEVSCGIMKDGQYVQELTIVKSGPQTVETVESKASNAQKTIVNGTLFILRDGKMYNVQGAEMK